MGILAGYLGDLYMAAGAPVAFTHEAMTDSGDHETYSITNDAKRYWDDSAAPTVEISLDSGSTWNAAGAGTYAVQYVGGVVTFTTVNASRSVRVSGNYLAASQVGNAYAWEVTPTRNIMDTTTFGNEWKQKTSGLKDAQAKASAYYLDGTFQNMLGERFILVLYVDVANDIRFEAYALLKTPSIKVSVDGTVDEDLEFEVDGTLYSVLS